MKPIAFTFEKQPTIEVEYRVLFFKRKRKFQAVSEIIKNEYWSWLELPNMRLVPDVVSFQLDAWLRNRLENQK